jgi:chemotaxis response regulator CheB
MRTLIVEDDAVTAALLGMMLEEMGIDVCGSESTESGAVRAAAASCPDLIIADVNLRIGTGTGAITSILADRPTPHVFVSGDLTHLQAKYPTSIMLQKPYVYGQMAEAIERAMAS